MLNARVHLFIPVTVKTTLRRSLQPSCWVLNLILLKHQMPAQIGDLVFSFLDQTVPDLNQNFACIKTYIKTCVYVCVPAVCSGEITDSVGVVLSPNWPEAYDKGQDCIWGIHVEEDKRIMLDIQVYVFTFHGCNLIRLPPFCPLPFNMHQIALLQTLSLVSLNLIITKPTSSSALIRTLVPGFKQRRRGGLKIRKSYLTMTGKTH